ncbi:MAG: OmpA family protein [Steroidobacteraceae bacterium]
MHAGALIALIAIALALASISKHLNTPPPPAPLLGSQDEATRAAAAAMSKMLIGKHMPAADADAVAGDAAQRLISAMKSDATGETARRVAGFSATPDPAIDPARAKELAAAALPFIKGALTSAAEAKHIGDSSIGLLDAISPQDLLEIRKGFFGGAGELPWDVIKGIVSGVFEGGRRGEAGPKGDPGQKGDPGIKGDPGARGERGLSAETPTPVTCPHSPEPGTSCAHPAMHRVKVLFRPDQFTIDSSAQTLPITEAARWLLEDPTLSAILWAYTDTTASDLHNTILARRRAESVGASLSKSNVPVARMRLAPMGEHDTPVATPDGTADAENRVVVIEIGPFDLTRPDPSRAK